MTVFGTIISTDRITKVLPMHSNEHFAEQADPAKVLSQAVVRASELMGLSKAALARILGISPSSAGRMFSGHYQLRSDTKEWEIARLFVRLFRSLDAMMAGDETALRSWLASPNQALAARPNELITDIAGLVHTLDYVDAYRARV